MLADRYRMLSFDMRGHGNSAHPTDGAPLSLDGLLDDLFAVADAAGVQRFHLVGESIGGTLALLAGLRAPERVLTLTVSNGAHIGGAIGNLDNWQQIIDGSGLRARFADTDTQLKARDLLSMEGVAPWVLFKLDGGLDHILIDEAQDTNPDQWQVVQHLAEEFFAGFGARPDVTRTRWSIAQRTTCGPVASSPSTTRIERMGARYSMSQSCAVASRQGSPAAVSTPRCRTAMPLP